MGSAGRYQRTRRRGTATMRPRAAAVLVFCASAAVLVLEILAGRLVAPYVGESLETYTGIIGTVLAGIALGSATGGRLSDHYDPRHLVGPTLVLGGALAWLSLPIVAVLGPGVGEGPTAIVVLSVAAFFLPAAVLSAVSPMAAKLRLADLAETGHGGRRPVGGRHGGGAGRHVRHRLRAGGRATRPGRSWSPSAPCWSSAGLVLWVRLARSRPNAAGRRRPAGRGPGGAGGERTLPVRDRLLLRPGRGRPGAGVGSDPVARHAAAQLRRPRRSDLPGVPLRAAVRRRGRRPAARAASTPSTWAAGDSPFPATSPPAGRAAPAGCWRSTATWSTSPRTTSACDSAPTCGSTWATPVWPSTTCPPTASIWSWATPSAACRCPGT